MIRNGAGETLWRPLTNPGTLQVSAFSDTGPRGFGLMQRARGGEADTDLVAHYERRPSLWVEPTSDWKAGRVMLMEIPTTNELTDNVVAMWEPATMPQPGDRIEFKYRQHWTMDEDPSQADGHVVATRTGIHDWQTEQRTIAVEFVGNALNQQSEIPLSPQVQAVGPGSDRVKIQGVTVQSMPEARWRVAFQIAPSAEGGKLSDVGPIELRCCIKRGENFLTETWVQRLTP